VPVDFSPASRRALARALDVARLHGQEVALLHVVDTDAFLAARADMAATLSEDARKRLDALAREADPERTFVKIVDVREGRPWRVILGVAESIAPELIVVGKRGAGPHEMGSVSERVVRGAPCDVLVVRGD
jgi:nucleotide-binding universal stress UspA family protein